MVEKKPKFDIDRRSHMLQFGLDEHESAAFLKDTRAALILAGAKNVASLKSHQHRIDLISKLKGKSLEVFRKWALKNLDNLDSATSLTGTLATLSETLADGFYDGENSKNLWRQILLAYLQPETQAEVEEFITPEKKIIKSIISPDDGKANVEVEEVVTTELEVQDIPTAKGFVVKKSISFSSEVFGEAGKLPVLGVSTNVLPSGQFFVHLAGAISDGNLIILTESESEILFPESGDATGYPDDYFGMSPPRDMLAIWSVKYHNAERKTRFLISDFHSRVYHVYKVPHASTEPDLVRAWIQHEYVGRTSVYPVFELSDGLIIKAPGDPTEFSNYNFDTPLNGYESHDAVSWQGKLIVIKPFPAAQIKYDCATINSAIKRLFKVRADISGFPVLTKGNLQDLAALASKESDDGLISQSSIRAIKSIESIFSVRENVEEFFSDILNQPEVVSRLNEEIQKVRAEQKTLLETGKNELAQLAAAKQKLLNEIHSANQSVKNEALELTRELKKAFDKAAKDGVKTLSEVAVLQSFIGASNAVPHNPFIQNKVPEKISLDVPNSKEIATNLDLTTAINLMAMQKGLSPSCLRLAISSLLSSGVLGLIGIDDNKIVSSISDVIAGGNHCSVSISADMFSVVDLLNAPVVSSVENIPAMSLGRLMECYQDISRPLIVELKGFNRFPPESVLNELLSITGPDESDSELAWRDSSGTYHSLKVKTPVFFFLTFTSGRSTFPIAGDQAYKLPILDANLQWPDKFEANSGAATSSCFIGDKFAKNFLNHHVDVKVSSNASVNVLTAKKIGRLTDALQLLGDPDKDAELLSYLTYTLGRYELKELANFVESSPSNLSGFINAYLNNFNTKTSKYIFEI